MSTGRSSRRDFLKTATGAAAGATSSRIPLGAQGARATATHPFPGIDPKLLMTPDLAWEWAVFKSEGGPTYAGSAGWKRFNDFLVSKAETYGLVDFVSVDVTYDRYVVDDWPDRRTHIYSSGIAVEKLVTDGTPVPVVASYGMTSGSTPPDGITAPMVFYHPASPPTEAQSAKAATDNKWPRVDVKARGTDVGVNSGYQSNVRSAVNKGREYGIPGLGLAGDWPGAWTQTYAQLDTEAGPGGFDKNYFVQQVAGMTQLTGELMMVKPIVIDFGWGDLHTALTKVPDSAFVNASSAATQRKDLINQYVGAFRRVEAGTFQEATRTLNDLNASISRSVVPGSQAAPKTLVDGQIAKLSSQRT